MEVDPRLFFLMRRLKETIESFFYGEKVRIIDVGCSDGSFIKIVSKHIAQVDEINGVDIPSKWTRDHKKIYSCKYYEQDLQISTGNIPLEHYHIATLWETIEHVENVYSFLKNLNKLLIPGGIILLSSPNLFSLSRFFKGARWVGVKETDHKYLFDKLSLNMVLERSGCKNVNISTYYLPSAGENMDNINKILSIFPFGGMLFAIAIKCA